MNVGTAKIVTNEGDGKYTITQQFIDTSDDTFKLGTVGLVAEDAWDANLDETRAVDDKIVFQMQVTYDGKRVPVIVGKVGDPADGSLAGSGPIELDTWFDIQGDVAWEDFDTRDWSGRFILVAAMYDGGSPVLGGSWSEAEVEHYNPSTAAWVTQVVDHWRRTWMEDGGFTQDITRIHQATHSHIDIRMNTDGHLQIQTTSYNARDTSVRYRVRAGSQLGTGDTTVII